MFDWLRNWKHKFYLKHFYGTVPYTLDYIRRKAGEEYDEHS